MKIDVLVAEIGSTTTIVNAFNGMGTHEKLEQIAPNLILPAAGTDYGERETALKNAELLCAANIKAPSYTAATSKIKNW